MPDIIMVRAKSEGYSRFLREVGEVFPIEPRHFSEKWMERVPDDTPVSFIEADDDGTLAGLQRQESTAGQSWPSALDVPPIVPPTPPAVPESPEDTAPDDDIWATTDDSPALEAESDAPTESPAESVSPASPAAPAAPPRPGNRRR